MPPDLQIKIGFYVVFLLATTAHEAAHAWAGLRLGDNTAYLGGQVTLDPIPHIRREPIGMVLLPIMSLAYIGFPVGFASAPYNPLWALRYPRRAAWMSLAGPAANLILLVLGMIGLRVGLQTELFASVDSIEYTRIVDSTGSFLSNSLSVFLSLLVFMNLLLLVFNLIPFPPLDGAGALPLFLPPPLMASVRQFYGQPWAPMVGLLCSWLIISELMQPIWIRVINLMYSGIQKYQYTN